jgi:hypothetical protein
MSYQPHQLQYHYTPANHWLDLLVKGGGLLVAGTVAAVMGAHMIHKYSPPTATAPVAQIVRYYRKGGMGAVGASSHWTMEASEGTREWAKAVRYCQAQRARHAVPGCAVINTLFQSGY